MERRRTSHAYLADGLHWCRGRGALLALAAPAAAQEAESAPEAVSMEGTLVGAHWPDVTAPACHLPGTAWRFKIVASGELSGLGEVEAYV